MGTPDFAVSSLDILVKNNIQVVAVVTAPDKPAGRGRKISISPVKKYALEKQIPVLQPTNLKDPEFIEEIKSYTADLQIVVAFRMLPEVIWKMPTKGTFNLHASLLPQYRGAAPINWAIINGETETGITTFFIDEKIDTGKIILSEKVDIGKSETAGELHDRLMEKGAELVFRTVKLIQEDKPHPKPQDESITPQAKLNPAPKIFKEDTRINWERPRSEIFNLIRGLSPYPAASTILKGAGEKNWILKIFNSAFIQNHPAIENTKAIPGSLISDNKSFLLIGCFDGYLEIKELQLQGKRRMFIQDFLRGFSVSDKWTVGNKA